MPEPEVRKMLSENAAQIYGFDLAALQPLADRVVLSPKEMATPPDALPTDTESNAFAGR